ncbi:hypothetical protein LCGC14_2506050, partial [marine sediment metagenome]
EWMTYKEAQGAGAVASEKADLLLPVMYPEQLVGDYYYEYDFRDASPERSNSYGVYFSFDGYAGKPDSYYVLCDFEEGETHNMSTDGSGAYLLRAFFRRVAAGSMNVRPR